MQKGFLQAKFHSVTYSALLLALLGGSLGLAAIMGDDIAYKNGVTSKRTISEILPEHIKKPPYNEPLLDKPLL